MPASFRTVRWIRTINLVLQAVLFLTLFGGLNYVAKNHPSRFDLTSSRQFSLSPETLSYIRNLERPVRIVVTTSEEETNAEVFGLVSELVHATEGRPGNIVSETLDIYRDRRRSEQLGIDAAGVVVLYSGDKRRVVRINELYGMKEGRRATFRGEQQLTAAILDVASIGRKKVYFIVGHSELRLIDTTPLRGLSAVREELALRNFEIDEIDLSVTRQIPSDAALLVIAAPSSQFSAVEQEMLRQYLSAQAGRLILILAPGGSTSVLGLDDLLLDWGVFVQDDVIVDTGADNVAENGDLMIYAFSEHPITKTLIEQGRKLQLGLTRTVMPDPGRSLGSGLTTVALAASSKTAWGERDYRNQPFKRDPFDTLPVRLIEPPDRLPVAVASERVGVRDNLPFSVRGGKMVVFGMGDFIANHRFEVAGNRAVFLNAVNWTVDRDLQLSIPPRPIERFQLSISAAEFSRLRYALLLILPGAALLLGMLVYWTRRS